MLPNQKKILINLIESAVNDLVPSNEIEIILEKPKIKLYGDISTNIAMRIAKKINKNPMDLAQNIVDMLNENIDSKKIISNIEIVKPGFINFYISKEAMMEVFDEIELYRDKYGHAKNSSKNKNILVEFVSANPTGPLHVGHARQAALGSAICQIYKAVGWHVVSEFYYNDSGNQIHNLAISVQSRAKNIDFETLEPKNKDLYHGEYIIDIAKSFINKECIDNTDGSKTIASGNIDCLNDIQTFAIAYLRKEQDIDLKSFGLIFDNYYLESSLYTSGKVEKTVQALINSGYTYEHEGALWLKTTVLTGDDKDRVMRKSNDGGYTYFVPDVAYHKTKWDRGFHTAINIQGSDHHGTVSRVRAGLQALSNDIPKNYPQYVLHKMVKIISNGEEIKISKRSGTYVTMRDLISWVGRDAARYFLIQRRADTEFIFDIDLAISQKEENPVYYIQYAYARLNSILKKANMDHSLIQKSDINLLTSHSEINLIKRLSEFPSVIKQSADELSPHLIAFWLQECAADCHSWYNSEHVIVEQENLKLARLRLINATLQVLRNGLTLLGVSIPEEM
ncbi:arginine--tRNA ligase [Candidatus Kinetoplastidibacterium crithidiae]|uniref:Arginine--tRNA ligase n=1 Tax=Candidatus Kinetoplastidibacterium crithidiae TCC036E TaxID=1208918 RepID=M1LNQ8_9PROT|nr:arginine--tRNA ligase [Candidatus Kinetoplastibacterium crithidii]AFZ83035.1 arginyl-tRNA synthetase [Candidatus Kinetoplastibacterium crithidii (ex Angomonas deanei ATCC 30255)]AGF47312.1 arginyl-tRNA synthetase [Candidatus Kinetoplastibacterium crithidii TCC036E]